MTVHPLFSRQDRIAGTRRIVWLKSFEWIHLTEKIFDFVLEWGITH